MFSRRTDWKLNENNWARTLREHRESGKPIIDLTASNPTTCGFSYDEASILAALSDPAALKYEPEPKGLPGARAAVIAYYRAKDSGTHLSAERLILTTGTSEAYSFLFRLLCEPMDEILIARPSYPLFDFLATIHDVNLRSFPLIYDYGWQIDFSALRGAVSGRTRAILLVHPNNPTGNFIRRAEAEQLQSICLEHSLALVVDEVFLDYEMETSASSGERHGTFVSCDKALTFVLSGLSKIAGLPQMKVGWIAASGPELLVNDAMARLEVIADTYLSLNAPVQHALPVLLAQRTTMQPQIMSRVKENLRQLDRLLAGQKEVVRMKADGGWCAVLCVPAVQSDEDLAIQLLAEHSVLIHPGHFYDFPGDGFVVVSLLAKENDFAEGIGRLLHWVAEG